MTSTEFSSFNMLEVEKTISPLSVLILDDTAKIRQTLEFCLQLDGHRVVSCASPRDAMAALSRSCFDLVFLDLRIGTENGLDYLPQILAVGLGAKVCVITAFASVSTAVQAMKAGATDYLTKPFTPDQVLIVTKKVAEQRRLEHELHRLQEALGDAAPEADLTTTTSAEMKDAVNRAHDAASVASPLLICGETGAGKNTLARYVHASGGRSSHPLVVAHCGRESIANLVAELFGTSNDYPGKVRAAEGGTLVIDGLSDMPGIIQSKMLDLIQTGTYERLGDATIRDASVRVIALTRSDPTYALGAKKLNPDFFYSFNGFRIDIPPLRSRPDDVVLLAERYLGFFCKQHRRVILGFAGEVIDTFRQYAWPGNIRELRNTIERACMSCRTDRIGINDLPQNQLNKRHRVAIGDPVPLEAVEEMHIRRVLESTESLDNAAEILGIDPATLWRKRKRFGV